MTDRETEWAALLRAANAGDGQAYALFLHAITPVLRGLVRARGRALDAASHEDVVQEVLLAIHLKRQTWRADAPLLPWLYAIARYKLADAFRRRGAAIHLPIEDLRAELAAPMHDASAARDSAVLLGRLDARSAAIVRAMNLEGESAAEVGQRLEMSEGAVRVALHRAMQRMMRIVKGDQG
ncbi:sigma-70 family RNA polymerase sigma factor [Paracoccus lutimaris]|uniref:RNA polymerase sigma-70 factor (ECF subfamily) n=1 Tax=Paracoccus lutimaris TaxID=1490030 RepID=A0A368Z719_9RHOB|nr:sigma-70 family RNA polymerase sigma factor [Paracoccus lutimaris]RCW88265.1 RNA polymerase sigma-70 factor (ECF subfamily) [Paracoccus lutimaris]